MPSLGFRSRAQTQWLNRYYVGIELSELQVVGFKVRYIEGSLVPLAMKVVLNVASEVSECLRPKNFYGSGLR